jgi:SAM-dependent methyltransferase
MTLQPPDDIADVGSGHFEKVGRRWFELLKRFGLEPYHRVLDPGCGAGRIAIPLTSFLTSGSYEGFDVSVPMIEWCRSEITPRFPSFRFQVADLYSKRYNPSGTARASEYRFPFDDGGFDFIYLTSVFTHMLPVDVERYLSEIFRVAKPDATVVATFFLLDDDSRRAVRSGQARVRFRWPRRGYRVASFRVPESAVAHDVDRVMSMYERCGLAVRDVHPGKWRGGPGLDGQDVIVASKPRA